MAKVDVQKTEVEYVVTLTQKEADALASILCDMEKAGPLEALYEKLLHEGADYMRYRLMDGKNPVNPKIKRWNKNG